MEEQSDNPSDSEAVAVPESPRPTAFTIDFGDEKKVDVQRQKTLAEKFQQRHKRGKSMSKLEDNNLVPVSAITKRHPLTGNLPRKSSFQSEDEKAERNKSAKVNTKRGDLTLQLKNITTDRMTQSFPSAALASLTSSDHCEIQNVSSPEFELISPFSPNISQELIDSIEKITLSSEESIQQDNDEVFSKTFDCDIDKKSDNVSETGTYTVDIENYSEEQKARMSIDNDFKIEQVSVQKKTEEYIRSLSCTKPFLDEPLKISPRLFLEETTTETKLSNDKAKAMTLPLKSPTASSTKSFLGKVLSPILSPTQNLSLVENRTTSSPKNQRAVAKSTDAGAVISVTSSGVFRIKSEEERRLERKLSLSKSEIHVEAYVDGRSYNERKLNNAKPNIYKPNNLTANIVNVQSIEVGVGDSGGVVSASLVFGKMGGSIPVSSGLPPTPTGKTSPSKIPSPIHSLSRPRSRNSLSTMSDDLDTEFILKPTQNYINTLQHKLSLDSDQDSDYEMKYGLQLNNTAHLMKQKASHIRHNSLDDKAINNKLEHFQNKNLQSIDQTYSNLLNQYKQNKVVNKINNSPSNSPIRRSSSFSNRNQINQTKTTNLNSFQKETNLCSSPSLGKNCIQNSIQRSSSTACIKPNYGTNGKRVEHRKIDRTQFGDTESSSEDDFDKELHKRKDLGNISNTRCNRTFSLRRARLDNEIMKPKCPNTPEMRRKSFQPESKPERAISVDRKSIKTNEVQSRYLLNISKRATPPPAPKVPPKAPSSTVNKNPTKSGAGFSRTESGRFSMRNLKPPTNTVSTKPVKKDGKNSKQSGGGRSNSSLSSREVEFQNWKRRKSYDPMKAAAEGKKKEMQKKLNEMTGSYTEVLGRPCPVSPDSSPSHSGSVHRSQSFHGTAALEQLISSDEEDMTLSADEGLSPPTPSPCELSPTRASLRHALWDRIHN